MSKLLAVLVAMFAAAWLAVPAFATGTGRYVEVCKASTGAPALSGTFTFTVEGHDYAVDVGHCTNPIPVTHDLVTITEASHPWYQIAAVNYLDENGVTHDLAAGVTETSTDALWDGHWAITVPVENDGIGHETVVNVTDQAVIGNLEVCKTATPTSGLTGAFTFAISGDFEANLAAPADVSVGVGACSLPFAVPAGEVLVTEQPTNAQTYVTDIAAQPSTALLDLSLRNATALVAVAPGPTAETMVTFENSQSSLKLCKRWGDAEVPAPTTPFSFTVSADGGPASTFSLVADDPASCVMVPLRYRAGSLVTITEGTFPGTFVDDITLNGASFDPKLADLATRTVTFPIAAGVNDVTFVNDPAPAVPLKVCKLGTGISGPFSFAVSPTGYTLPFLGLAGATAAPTTVTVPAPNQCAVVGWFPYDQTVTITEAAGNLTKVAVDLTSATATIVGTPNLAARSAMVLLGNYDLIPTGFAADWAVVDFTNGPPAASVSSTTTSTPAVTAPTVQSPVATPAGTSVPVVAPTKVATLKVVSSRIVKVGKTRYVVVRVNGAAKTARVHVSLIGKQHKVVSRLTRYVATNKAVRIGNLRLSPSILSVKVSL